MSNLYHASVSDSQFRQDGIGYFVQHGEPLTVNGTPMVRVGHGTIVLAAGWHASHSDALLEAAQKIEELGHLLLNQADTLRKDAARKAQVANATV